MLVYGADLAESYLVRSAAILSRWFSAPQIISTDYRGMTTQNCLLSMPTRPKRRPRLSSSASVPAEIRSDIGSDCATIVPGKDETIAIGNITGNVPVRLRQLSEIYPP